MDYEHPGAAEGARHSGKASGRRIVWIDIARGLAIVAMAIYHFAWDLQHFGYITAPTVDIGIWRLFARADASSFIFLVGVSLVLAHHRGIRWHGFIRRLAMIVAAALAITAVTYVLTPQTFIFFGILHLIAAGSLIGLLFLRVPSWLTLIAAVATFVAPWFLASPFFDTPVLWFVGLSADLRPSSDYVPLLPWMSALLAGVALSRLALSTGLFEWLRGRPPGNHWLGGSLAFGGRHSLAVYLLHQPLLYGIVYLASLIAPAPAPDPIPAYLSSCQANCAADNDAGFCHRFCTCTVNRLLDDGLFNDVVNQTIDVAGDPRIKTLAGQCTRNAETNVQ